MLSGVGRGLAVASDVAMAGPQHAGAFPICHAGPGDGSVPDEPQAHDCCDACALLAPAIAGAPPPLSRPVVATGGTTLAAAVASWPATARRRTPRQSQGPPAA